MRWSLPTKQLAGQGCLSQGHGQQQCQGEVQQSRPELESGAGLSEEHRSGPLVVVRTSEAKVQLLSNLSEGLLRK